jgi:tetratricopeptide (TPR) repeat protein
MRLWYPSLFVMLLWSGPARALSCDEVMLMVDVGVPISIVVQTVRDAAMEDDCPRAPIEVREAIAPRPTTAPPMHEPLAAREAPPSFDNPPTALPAAIDNAAGNRNNRRAAIELAALLPGHPDHAAAIHALLARRLLDLGLPHSAHSEALTAVRFGPGDPGYAEALTALVATSSTLGDSGDLAALIVGVPIDRYPAAVADELHYQRGMALYAADELAAARNACEQVPTTSPRHWQARYTSGVIHATQGKLKTAFRTFSEVVRADSHPKGGPPPPSEALRDLALLGAASIYYDIERFDEVLKYADLPPDSPLYARNLLMRAWAHFMAKRDPLPDLDLLDGLDVVWAPEALYLRTLWAYTHHEYGAAATLAATWLGTHDPVVDAMSALLRPRPGEEAGEGARSLYRRLVDPDQQALPPGLVAELFRDNELRQARDHLALFDREDRRLRRTPPAFREALGDTLRARLAADRKVLEQRAGARLQTLLTRSARALADLRFQVLVLQFEAVDAQALPGHQPGPASDRLASTALLRKLLTAPGPAIVKGELRLRLAARVDDSEAITICEQLLQDPEFALAEHVLYQLALADPDRTVALMGQLVADHPASTVRTEAWLVLGDDHFARGRLAEAQDAYERAAMEPGHLHYGYALYKLGWVHYALGDAVNGERLLGQAIGVTRDPQLRLVATQDRARLVPQ